MIHESSSIELIFCKAILGISTLAMIAAATDIITDTQWIADAEPSASTMADAPLCTQRSCGSTATAAANKKGNRRLPLAPIV